MASVCFMIMPFGKKPTGAPSPAPAEVDFDALWENAYKPMIRDLGFEPVRADQELGAMIIAEMLERLYFSDLVMADLSIPNGNVYYEVGVRHAAKDNGCILFSAEWSKQLFDLEQMRQIRYPLSVSVVDRKAGDAIRAAILEPARGFIDQISPFYQTIPGYPDQNKIEPNRAGSIQSVLDKLAKFQAEVSAIRNAPSSERETMAKALIERHPPHDGIAAQVASELVTICRDHVGWQETCELIDKLPGHLRNKPLFEEQYLLALGKSGDMLKAIGGLEQLIAKHGDSSERQGLLGGRYKTLMRNADNDADKKRYLNKAIEHYRNGMMLDLNDFFPSCNLPPLYRQRGRRGDEDRAQNAAFVAQAACDRAIQLNSADEWTRPTLLGLAFGRGDVEKVEELVEAVQDEGPAAWKLDTTIKDLESMLEKQPEDVREDLADLLAQLKSTLG